MGESFPPEALERWARFREDRRDFERRALRLAGNPADAADLVQEVELRVLRHPTGPRPDACFRAWCFGLLRNAASDQRRSSGRRARAESLGAQDPEQRMSPRAVDPELDFDLRRLADRLQALSGSARDLIIRRYFLEETATEIARDVNSSPPAIRMKLKRLRFKLRELLGAVALISHLLEMLSLTG